MASSALPYFCECLFKRGALQGNICFVEEDPDRFIQVMVTYMEEIAIHCKSLALDKWGAVLENLEKKPSPLETSKGQG